MDALTFLETHGREVTKALAERAGTNMAYFAQLAHGHRRPSVKLADRLVTESEAMVEDPEKRLDLLSLLKPQVRTLQPDSAQAA